MVLLYCLALAVRTSAPTEKIPDRVVNTADPDVSASIGAACLYSLRVPIERNAIIGYRVCISTRTQHFRYGTLFGYAVSKRKCVNIVIICPPV
jgi:UDP-3-O-[3-hydroxymyristoyl] glucosamine N-acyltransferase